MRKFNVSLTKGQVIYYQICVRVCVSGGGGVRVHFHQIFYDTAPPPAGLTKYFLRNTPQIGDNIQRFHSFAGNSQNVKTIARGTMDDPMHYHPRPQGLSTAPRAIDLIVATIRHEIVVLLPTNVRVSLLYARKLSLNV